MLSRLTLRLEVEWYNSKETSGNVMNVDKNNADLIPADGIFISVIFLCSADLFTNTC
jgi:hypothetical protein